MTIAEAVAQFLFHCQYEKNLSPKTLKAYSIDLRQFSEHLAQELEITDIAVHPPPSTQWESWRRTSPRSTSPARKSPS